MKHLLKIALLLAIISTMTLGVYGQVTMQSRLNVGVDAKKQVELNKNINFFSDFPNKLNLNAKAEYTQFYRDLLLNQVGKDKAEGPKQITGSVNKTVVEKPLDKIKFGKVFPNPADAYAIIQTKTNTDFKSARIVVMNMVGEILQEHTITKDAKEIRLNTVGLTSGIYMVQGIVDGKKVMTQKLLVDHN